MQMGRRLPSDPEEAARCGAFTANRSAFRLLAVAQDGAGGGEPDSVAKLLDAAGGALLSESVPPALLPGALAARLADILAARREGEPEWLLFASALVTVDAVHVCTAGDIRVHLLRGGRVIRSTRDHVLANESPDWVRATYGDLPPGQHDSMITRTLGSCALPPESQDWPVQPPFSVLVCSSAQHGHRPPEVYAQELLEAAAREDAPLAEGVLAYIDV